MADSKELKPVSFRIVEETKEKIKEIAISTGGNQQETMQLLINAYYMQQQKVELVEHKATIEDFERCTTNLLQMFTGSLKANHDLRESVMQEFSATLESKDQVIQDLQEKVKAITEKKDEAIDKAKIYSDQVVELIKQVTDLEKMLEAKSSLTTMQEQTISERDEKVTELKGQMADMIQQVNEAADIRSNLVKITAERDEMKKSLHDAEEAVKRANTDAEMALKQQKQQLELTHEKAMLEAERKHDEEIRKIKAEQQQEVKAMLEVERKNGEELRKIKAEHQQEIDRYQQKYLSLLEKMQSGADAE